MTTLFSIWIWIASTTLIVAWYPILAVRRWFDKDPALYKTGRLFRDLGTALTKVNPLWKIQLKGAERIADPRNPYVVVSNHQSMADIPVLSNLPWEMKWMAKRELFKVPFVGWQLKLAGDIAVDRENPRDAVQSIRKAKAYLAQKCSVMVFPEGTRSPDGNIGDFHDGAFRIAIDACVPVLPVVVDGTFDCLPKNSWKFGAAEHIKVEVLEPISTDGLKRSDMADLRTRVRAVISDRLDELRRVS